MLTRRQSLLTGAALLGSSSIPLIGARAADLDVPTADVKQPEFKIEKGATLRVLRPAKFVAPDETFFNANTKKFTETTGIQVRVDYVGWEDIQPQTAMTANTGAGADIIIGFGSSPQIYHEKLLRVDELADYLGKKYGGWLELSNTYCRHGKSKDWLAIPMGGSGTAAPYRVSWLKEAGFSRIPDDHAGFLDMAAKLNKNGHPVGFALGHAVGDANGFCDWMLWSHNARLMDESGKVALDSKETLAALKFAKDLYPNMIQGTMSWGDPSNNKAYLAGDISTTFNGISIYFAAKTSTDAKLQAIAADTMHQAPPMGLAKRNPAASLVVAAMVFKHSKFPNAAKEYLRFMMEAPQYAPWLANCMGYWSNPLRAYGKMPFWNSDPNFKPYIDSMDTPYYDAYAGPITDKSSAIAANYTVVDMFASVASGNATPESAVKQAAKQAARYLRT